MFCELLLLLLLLLVLLLLLQYCYEEQEKNSHPGMFLAHKGVVAYHLARRAVNEEEED